MAKSMLIYGVPGGKTRFAQRIADHLGLKLATVCDGASPWYPDGWLYFSPRIDAHESTAEYSRSFQSVADEINATIPLTDWQSGPPPMVGEWNASFSEEQGVRRWWNGECWSQWYVLTDTADEVARYQGMPAAFANSEIKWRGLSSEPIKVTE